MHGVAVTEVIAQFVVGGAKAGRHVEGSAAAQRRGAVRDALVVLLPTE